MMRQRIAVRYRWAGPRHTLAGFTIAELIVGSALLLTALVSLAGALIGFIQAGTFTQHQTQAINDANMVMEELRNRQAKKRQDSTSALFPPADNSPLTSWLTGVQGASRLLPNEQVIINTQQVGGDPNLLRIAVKVSWDDRQGNPFVRLVSLFDF